MELKSMSIDELFDSFGEADRVCMVATKAAQAAKDGYDQEIRTLSEIVKPDKMEAAIKRWMADEKANLVAAFENLETAKMAYNDIGREIDLRRMKLDEQKVKQGIA